VGIWAGALLVSGFNPIGAFLRTFDTYFVGAFVGEGNAEVLLFTFLLGGTIGLVQRSGGALGLANALKRFMGERREETVAGGGEASPADAGCSATGAPAPSCWRSVLACTGQSYLPERRFRFFRTNTPPRSYCLPVVSQAHGLGDRSSPWR